MMGFSLLYILQPTDIPKFDPALGKVHRAAEDKQYKGNPEKIALLNKGKIKCNKCGNVKDISNYGVNPRTVTGREGSCTMCRSMLRKRGK
jgi:PHP family Zn ribbon phosphoesterase